ncbi:beta-ketoacyl synthase N-terminal-like domain-containing protein [Amycolatopsis anabasis]|uniref:beta-ketoacyl synthase N-terminal-like domain-containing protein n=1 Tax=Amycolatopsis anabasis TaxID=1840409 RepID=UPI00131D7A2A|nr:beta-ketoacyl synthase N-terminal-like domain-containing protein [Amycolatopsis anabasis]
MSAPVISAWTAISPYGYDRAAFAGGIRARRGTAATAHPDVPEDTACTVPGFDPREFFGPKGTRAMNRVSGLTVAAAKHLLADIGVAPGEGSEDVGFVLGTTTGSAQSMMDLTRASLTGDKPDHVEPAAVPGCVMNCAAGQAAIWHGLKGPNATIAAGRTTGLQALNYARRLLRTGRAGQVLCGAAEEYSSARSWLEHHRRANGGAVRVMAEGCAMFLLEPADRVGAGRTVLATLSGLESRVCLDSDLSGAIGTAVRSLLERSGVPAERVWAATGSDFLDADGTAVESIALRALFGDEVVDRVPPAGLIGDTSSATALFQLAAVLSVAEPGRGARDHAVVTACDDDGSVACALFELGGEPGA